MPRISLWVDLYMTWKDQVCIVNVVVTNPTQETVISSVISQPTSVVAELSTIAKIRKYRKLHKGHHFIPMAMEVHDALGRDMDCFISAHIFHDRQSKGHLSLSSCI
jgi:hypothetical protein